MPATCVAACSCCGAGTAADTENVTELISSNLELHRLSTGRKVSNALSIQPYYYWCVIVCSRACVLPVECSSSICSGECTSV